MSYVWEALWTIWVAACLFAGLALLSGCATGLPGSHTRNFYNLCIVEGQTPAYCEAWAPVQASQLTAGIISGSVVVPVPVGR